MTLLHIILFLFAISILVVLSLPFRHYARGGSGSSNKQRFTGIDAGYFFDRPKFEGPYCGYPLRPNQSVGCEPVKNYHMKPLTEADKDQLRLDMEALFAKDGDYFLKPPFILATSGEIKSLYTTKCKHPDYICDGSLKHCKCHG